MILSETAFQGILKVLQSHQMGEQHNHFWNEILEGIRKISNEESSKDGENEFLIRRQKFLESCLRTATIRKLLSIVKKLIEEENVDPDAKDSDGTSPIMIAATQGDVETLEFFLSLSDKINVNAQRKSDMTALHYACYCGFEEVVRILLGHPQIRVNVTNKDGRTPLHSVCFNGSETIVSLLLDREDIQVNKSSNNMDTALMIACTESHAEVVKLLLRRDEINVNAQNVSRYTALMCACVQGNTEIVKSLLDHKDIDVNLEDSNDETALVWACDNDQIDVISLLLQREDLQRTVRNIQTIVSFVMDEMDMDKCKYKVITKAVIEKAVSKNLPDIARWLLKIEGYLASACIGSAALTGYTAARRGCRPVMKRKRQSQPGSPARKTQTVSENDGDVEVHGTTEGRIH